MGVNGKQKGSSFERRICKMMTDYTGLDFRRSFGSGAFKSKHKELDESGDIKCEDPSFPYSIECKFYSDIDYHNILAGDCSRLDKWLKQCVIDARHQNKHGLLIFKTNRVDPFFAFCFRREVDGYRMLKELLISSCKTYLIYKGVIIVDAKSIGKNAKLILKGS